MTDGLIESELAKVSVATVGPYDAESRTYFIPKHVDLSLEADNCYLIKVSEAVVAPKGNDMLSSNWNNGTHPACRFMKVDVTKLLGTMAQVNGVYYDNDAKADLNGMWSGWIPVDQIEIISKL